MKRIIWIPLMLLTLALAAAQCGALTPSDNQGSAGTQAAGETQAPVQAESSAPAETESAAVETEEAVAEAASSGSGAQASGNTQEKAAPENPTETASSEAMADSGEHSAATCDDPFAGVDNIRFSPQIWKAEQISRIVGSELVSPDSGLETNFCKRSVDYNEILSGGPPPDGIPPIDNPNFDSIETGDEWLADVQPVIALVVEGQAKAYPLAILTRHEIANDEIASLPVAVTFCPLCNAAVVFKREVEGQVLRFGVSGNLRNSDLIMWDDKTLSWWQQFTGEAIVGDMTGAQLEMIPAQLVSWGDFKRAYPKGVVLSNNGRPYGQNPYTGYDSSSRPFLYLGAPDPRLHATERVLGYARGHTSVAYPLATIRQEKVIEDTLDGQDVVIFYEPGQVSALDHSVIEQSKEVGSAGMFIPKVDGQKLTFKYEGGKIIDNETGSQWDVFGRAVEGELAGAQLEPVLSHMHFWFAWAAFKPDTRIYGG